MDRTSNKSTCQQLAALLLLLVSEIIRNNKLPGGRLYFSCCCCCCAGCGSSPKEQSKVLFPGALPPELNGVVKTTCVIDAVQAATYLGKAVVNIYRAEICPDGEPLGCTAPMN